MLDEDKKILAVNDVDVTKAIRRFMGNEKMYCDFLVKFINDPNMAELKKAYAEKNFKKAFEAAHALKGVSGNLGLQSLYLPIIPVVEKLRSGGSDVTTEEINMLDECNENICEVIKSLSFCGPAA